MAKERSLARAIIVNFWNSIKPRNIWGTRVGVDYNGTHYYEIPLTKSSTRKRPPRWFVPRSRDNFQQEIPPEWEAWLRYRRSDPPTEQEIETNLRKALEIRANAAELDKQYPKAIQQAETSMRVTSKNFPLYDDLEGTPGGCMKGNRNT